MAVVTLVTAASSPSFARKCSAYEREVYETARAVADFRQSDQFVNRFGWSAAGPYNKWLQKIQEMQADKENALKLMGKYGFSPMDIYSVADEYRTTGGLDSFYQDVEKSIVSLKCK